jgi:hypothetical protein
VLAARSVPGPAGPSSVRSVPVSPVAVKPRTPSRTHGHGVARIDRTVWGATSG